VLNDICDSGIVGAWQSLWIAHVAGDLAKRRGKVRQSHVLWLKQQLSSDRPALRAEAVLALARRGLTRPADVMRIASSLPTKHRPTALVALVALGATDDAEAIAESELDRLRIDWAERTLAQ